MLMTYNLIRHQLEIADNECNKRLIAVPPAGTRNRSLGKTVSVGNPQYRAHAKAS